MGLLVTVVISACSDAPVVAETPFAERDSSGVRIVENASVPIVDWSPDVSAERVLYGTQTGDVDLLEGRLRAIFFDDQHIFIANLDDGVVMRFDSSGALRSRVGRLGAGPGEFRYVDALVRTANGIAVHDTELNRVTPVFATGEMDLAGVISIRRSSSLVGIREDGAVLLVTSTGFSPRTIKETGVVRPDIAVYVQRENQQDDTIAIVPDSETYVLRSGTVMDVFSPPYPRLTFVTPLGDDLLLATAERSEVRVLSDARLQQIWRWGLGQAVGANASHDSMYLADMLGAADVASTPKPVDDAVRELVRTRSPAPYTRILTDPTARLWIRLDEPMPLVRSRWLVLSAAGRASGIVVAPDGCVVLAFGVTRALCRTSSEADTTRVWTVPLPASIVAAWSQTGTVLTAPN